MKTFEITGMSCASCVARVESAVKGLDGVSVCQVNLLTNSMAVEGGALDSEIIKAVKDAGYGAKIKEENDENKESKEATKLLKILLVSALFLLPLMYLSMGYVMWSFPLPSFLSGNYVAIGIIQGTLALIIMVINKRFFINGTKGLIKRAPNMGTLVALGSLASFIYSLVVLIIMAKNQDPSLLHTLYFESAGMVLVLITFGKMLEAISKGKTTNALKDLAKLKPKEATIIKDGQEIIVPIDKIQVGDIFIVKAGESACQDGVIVEGFGAFDESSLTGESIPVDKKENDKVYQSTINKSGYVKVRATQVGNDTGLSKIIKAVAESSGTKAPIAKLADRVSGIFVPCVLALAFVTTLVWLLINGDVGNALTHGISVLVISCPCALGLATPVAIMVGNGVGAKRGILFKNAEALENTGKVEIAVFDKTGTLTKGKPIVTDVVPVNFDENELLKLAYSLENKSEHPLALAICQYAKEKGITPLESQDYKTFSGSGVGAIINGKEILGGSYSFMGEPQELKKTFDKLSSQGKTPIFIKQGGTIVGAFGIADEIKSESKIAIQKLKEMGIYTVMLTGDNEQTAKATAKEIEIDRVIAGVLPEGKGKAISALQKYGKVMMIGDGINDSVALATSDIGVAIGAGTDIAIDTASVVLTKSSPLDVVGAIKLSRATYNNICQNLFWAFIYNCIAITIAVGVFSPLGLTLSPMIGAFAMSLSSVCVVTNALRLNLFKDTYKYKRKQSEGLKEIYQQETIYENEKKEINQMKEIKLQVEGMMCHHCERSVKQAVEGLVGVIEAIPNHKENLVIVKVDGNEDLQAIIDTITDLDYVVKPL
ncbi:MAG: heavy metal translocating P-type ATPase [Clostridia bacterium]|nr:heavy metal translocating P-type ATPase [Clostridia bacterium]